MAYQHLLSGLPLSPSDLKTICLGYILEVRMREALISLKVPANAPNRVADPAPRVRRPDGTLVPIKPRWYYNT